MRVDRPLLLFLAALTAGCADPEPFVDFGNNPTMEKPKDPVLVNGTVAICYSSETPWAEVEALAAERCAAHGLHAISTTVTRWQCRTTSPHRASFSCYDPEMVLPNGAKVNPFDPKAVAAWEKATGKKAKPHNFMTGQKIAPGTATVPPSPADAAPPAVEMAPMAAPAVPPRPFTPADIAGRPAIQPLPQQSPPPTASPAPPGAAPVDNFTLPQGSWGDHFQE